VDAGKRFVVALRANGVAVATTVVRRPAASGATEIARVQSPTVASLVEQMLRTSDNDLAEALLRHVAVARSLPATFDGGTGAVLRQLEDIGVPSRGTTLLDGSGLSRGSRVAPATVAGVLAAASDPAQPNLRPLLTGLPVAGFNGTLAERYTAASTRAAAGAVRAKTGTLTGVSALAGVVHLRSRVLVFVVMADRVAADGTLSARDRLDRVAAALAACGCR
jgi:D-alanyl-D-alanine carboxypeptidase/D-alanyl-D-alanine-endopeptidase (penicillin-binding protein 4)